MYDTLDDETRNEGSDGHDNESVYERGVGVCGCDDLAPSMTAVVEKPSLGGCMTGKTRGRI